MKRKRFPVMPAFAMTINKAQDSQSITMESIWNSQYSHMANCMWR
ncbi:hypothetical protein PC128_g16455 [Phytophthora cactorum]|uniref:Uncharacterized protein n=1 Tax=Phytophthora cactorum TaxID=29920 RepID=A0A8T1CW85_9STRA|nr:hypothetical protein PC117_g14330 [Phytophthora cactorum]KAG3178288.1 hypothetical protein PC128_g16455 [Phytophthora cactorum]